MLKSPRRQNHLPKLDSILLPRSNLLVLHQHNNSTNQGNCSKINVEFKSPSKKQFSVRQEAIQSICSFQKQIMRKFERQKKEKQRYQVLTSRDGGKQNQEDIFVRRDRLSVNRKHMHQRMLEYSERVSSSMKQAKPVRLQKIPSGPSKPCEELSGWNDDMDNSIYFDLRT